ncbi:MAG: Two-component system-sensor histidine kinase [Chlorobi bacterium]|nr:Two-component system-sensor histidine kinase [Chlorobiota bacterium]
MADSIEQLEGTLAGSIDERERVITLNQLSGHLLQIDPQRSLRLAEEAHALALSTGDRPGEASSLRAIAHGHDTLSDYLSAMTHARRAHALFRKMNDRTGVADALISIGIIARGMTDVGVAMSAFSEALELFREQDDRARMAAAYNNIGTIHSGIGNLSEALEAYLVSIRLYEEVGDELSVAIITGNIGNIHYYLGDFDTSLGYHHRSLELARRLGNTYSEALSLGNISSIHKARGEYQAAFNAVARELEIFQTLGEKHYEAVAHLKIAMLHDLQGDSRSAVGEMRAAAKIAVEIGSRDTYVDAQFRIGVLHRDGGEFRQALTALKSGLAMAEEAKLLKPEMELREVLADVCASLGDFPEAYRHLQRCDTLRRDIFSEDRRRAIAEMQARFDVERAGRERELSRLKSEHRAELAERRSRDLTSMANHLAQKNTFLQKLRRDVVGLSERHPEGKKALDEILRSIAEHSSDDEEWRRFDQEFQRVHHDFIAMLSERCPRLTPSELKLCALLKSNLSNKEIARLLSVSMRNVESHRYAIRRKLGLTSDINLASYLAGLQIARGDAPRSRDCAPPGLEEHTFPPSPGPSGAS